VGKLGLAGSSLAAALPGAGLFYLLLMGFLGGVNGMPMPMQVALGLLMLISLLMVLFPLYILIMFRRDKVVLANSKAAAPAVAAAGTGDAEVFTDESLTEGTGEEIWETPEDSFEGTEDFVEAEAVDLDVEDHLDTFPNAAGADEDLAETLEFTEAGNDVSDEDIFQTEEIDEFGKTMIEDGGDNLPHEEFDAPPTFDDEFHFEDFEDDDPDKTKH
jgi:Protein of unknown function (DUF2029).